MHSKYLYLISKPQCQISSFWLLQYHINNLRFFFLRPVVVCCFDIKYRLFCSRDGHQPFATNMFYIGKEVPEITPCKQTNTQTLFLYNISVKLKTYLNTCKFIMSEYKTKNPQILVPFRLYIYH